MIERKNAVLPKKPDRLFTLLLPQCINKIQLISIVLEHPDLIPLVIQTGSAQE